MGGVCSAYGEEERRIQGFGGGYLRERDNLGDQRVDGRVILSWIFRKWDVRVLTGSSWFSIGERRQALVTAVMNVRVPLNAGNFLTS